MEHVERNYMLSVVGYYATQYFNQMSTLGRCKVTFDSDLSAFDNRFLTKKFSSWHAVQILILNGNILKNFRPSLSYHLSFRSLSCLFSDRFTQVLLYIKF